LRLWFLLSLPYRLLARAAHRNRSRSRAEHRMYWTSNQALVALFAASDSLGGPIPPATPS